MYTQLCQFEKYPNFRDYIQTHIYCGKADLENVLQSYVCVEGHFHVMVRHGWLV